MKRFWDKVNKTDTCWNWIAGGRGNGYGAFKYKGQTVDSHRMAWFISYGYFSKKFICHTCDNRKCIKPAHLFEGSPRDNVLDGIKKGRMKPWINSPVNKKGCISSGRKLTFEIAEQIRREYLETKTSYRKLGKKYGITNPNILNIIQGNTYNK